MIPGSGGSGEPIGGEERRRRLRELLLPGGEPVGRSGRRREIRNVPGGMSAAESMFDELAGLGQRTGDPGYEGDLAVVEGLGKVGFRRESLSPGSRR